MLHHPGLTATTHRHAVRRWADVRSLARTGLDFAYPEAAKIGGLASGPAQRAPALADQAQGAKAGPDITIAGIGRPAAGDRGWPLVCWSAGEACAS